MRCRLAVTLLVLSLTLPAYAANELGGSPSPYLAMHGEDPVDWHLWTRAAIEKARKRGKPIFVSSGYFACHWCHVMHRESYLDAEVARLMNRVVVSVKVDRELQPGLDAHLVQFVQTTRGYAGWPLNVVLTPAGHPLIGFTYLPRDVFVQFLQELDTRWRTDREKLEGMAERAGEYVYRQTEPATRRRIDASQATIYRDAYLSQAMQAADVELGGFGRATKFPSTPQLQTLLGLFEASHEARLGDFLTLTLDKMATQGLRDHLAGGFFRYSTDRAWQVPHFEKMLSDNALLASLYMRAARLLERPDYLDVARDTLDFMLDEMRAADGAFITSLSAVDERDVQGGYYLWEADTLERVLEADEARVLGRAWHFVGSPELEAGKLPVIAASPEEVAAAVSLPVGRVRSLLASAKAKLRDERRTRSLPRDNKVLAAWNALALSALSTAAQLPGGQRYREAAQTLRNRIVGTLWDGERLARARGPGGAAGQASLEDYAFVAKALQDWAGLSGASADAALAASMLAHAWDLFRGTRGWRLARDILIPYVSGEPILADGSLPSPSAVFLDAALDDSVPQPGFEGLHDHALDALSVYSTALVSFPFSYASQVRVMMKRLR